jgi:PKD repeat protein
MLKKYFFFLFYFLLIISKVSGQTWQDVGGGHNNSSHGMCLYNGTLIDVGSFNNPCNRVGQWNGSNWSCFGSGVGLVGRAAIEYNGDLIVVGDFWNVQQPCVGCNGVARWDGSSWQPLGTGFNNDVLCLTIWNGYLVAGGDFTTADGNPVSRIAYWDGTSWNGIGGINDFDNDIRAMCVYDGELWVGGDFSNVAGCTSCDGLVRWDGTAWLGGDSGVDITGGVDSTVRCLYVDPINNLLYMGGHFQGLTVNGVYDGNLNGVAVYDGSDWYSLGTGVNNYVRALGEYNGNIIVGGDFTTAGGTTANKIAKWNPTNQTWSAMGTGMNDYVKSLAVYNGELYVGGPFTIADGQTRNCIAKWFENPVSPPSVAFTPSSTTACPGNCLSFADISTNNPTSWTWSFPGAGATTSTSQNPTNICYPNPGNFVVTLQACNSAGCSTASQTITITGVNASAGADQVVCQGGTVALNASGGTNYLWSPSASLSCSVCPSPIASPTVTTQYTLTVTNSFGCSATDIVQVAVVNPPLVSVGADDTICLGNSVALVASGTGNFQWSPSAGLSCVNCSSPIASPSATTSYTVALTNSNGCTSIDSVTVNVEVCTNITTDETIQGVSIFPNPANEWVQILHPDFFNRGKLLVIDVTGKVLLQDEIVESPKKLILHDLNPGIYILQIENDKQIYRIKLIKND